MCGVVNLSVHASRRTYINADMICLATADSGEQVWKKSLTIGRVVNATDIPTVSSRPGGPCNDIGPYYGADFMMLDHRL